MTRYITHALRKQIDALQAAEQSKDIILEEKIKWNIKELLKELNFILTLIYNRMRVLDLTDAQQREFEEQMHAAWYRMQEHLNNSRL